MAQGNGQIPLSVANDLKPNSNPLAISYLLFNKSPDANGHHYLTVNYLGKDVDIDAAWKLVTEHLSGVFPTSQVTGPSGPIRMGNQYNLVIGGVPHTPTFVFPVAVTAMSRYTFTFTTRQGHWLQGSATHGIVKDADGEVWLFHEGVGVRNEPMPLQVMNYAIADSLWARMASNVRSKLGR